MEARSYNCPVRSRFGLAALVGAAIGLVGGFVIGGIGPRRELADAQREIDRLEDELESGGGRWRSPVPGLDRILRSPDDEESAPTGEPRARAETDERVAEVVPVDGLDGGVPRESWRDRWRSRARESREERYDAFTRAASVQRVRRMKRMPSASSAGINSSFSNRYCSSTSA